MKNLMLTIGLAAALATGLNAQSLTPVPVPDNLQQSRSKPQLSPAERAKKDAEHAEKMLGLSGEQRSKWEAASLERAASNQPIREKMKGCTTPQERKDYHSQMRANHEKYNTTVVSLLTPEQKTKYEQQKKERREAHRSKKGKHHRMQDK